MSSEVTIAQLEQQRTDYQKLVDDRDAILKLHENPLFRKVITEDFMVKECATYAQQSANPALNAESRADSLGIAQAAGHLKRYLSVKIQMGNQAAKTIGEIDDAIEEIRVEGGDA